jgi:hypothetical protein
MPGKTNTALYNERGDRSGSPAFHENAFIEYFGHLLCESVLEMIWNRKIENA